MWDARWQCEEWGRAQRRGCHQSACHRHTNVQTIFLCSFECIVNEVFLLLYFFFIKGWKYGHEAHEEKTWKVRSGTSKTSITRCDCRLFAHWLAFNACCLSLAAFLSILCTPLSFLFFTTDGVLLSTSRKLVGFHLQAIQEGGGGDRGWCL